MSDLTKTCIIFVTPASRTCIVDIPNYFSVVAVGIASATDVSVCPARPATVSFHGNGRTSVVVMHNNKMVLDWVPECNVKFFSSHFKR